MNPKMIIKHIVLAGFITSCGVHAFSGNSAYGNLGFFLFFIWAMIL